MAADDRQLAAGTPQNPAVQQVLRIYKEMPLSRRISMAAVVALVIAGFAVMFFWANRIDYQTVYSGLSAEDAAKIVEKLKEQNIPYQLAGNGTVVRVPAEQVYDVRLSMAAAGLPTGGAVGYELFDETDFGTTEFVQKMNYQRALQGELSRTIKEFREVEDARVMIVMPKDSVFIEETKPPSVSVMLKLRGELSKEKVQAVVHLVAGAVEGMSPENVAVVDTKGRVLFKGASEEEKIGEMADNRLQYKLAYEKNMAQRIQTMLERIVGPGKAIVRVTADMDFDQVDINEEIYDPDVTVVRSRQNLLESVDRVLPQGEVSSVDRVLPPGETTAAASGTEKRTKQDETVNYELNRTLRRTVKPVGILQRLSVAAVLDGTYRMEPNDAGENVRVYVPRTAAELEQFKSIVQNAMGYSEDREDQVTVESFSFSETDTLGHAEGTDWKNLWRLYGKSLINILLILALFIFVVLPLIRTMKEIKTKVVESLPPPETERKELPDAETRELLDLAQMQPKDKAKHYANENIEKTSSILRGWVAEKG